MRRTLLPILLFSLFSDFLMAESITGTAIVIIRTDDEIVVAADSRAISERYPDWKPVTTNICKIHKLHDTFYFATAGFRSDFTGTFNVVTAIRKSHNESRSISQTVEASEAFIRSSFLETLNKHKRENPENFKKNFARSSVVDLAFVGVEHGSMVVYIRRLRAQDDVAGLSVNVHPETCPGHCRTPNEILMIGDGWRAMNEYVRQLDPKTPARLAEVAKNAVSAAIAKSQTVGLPIDILRIDRRGSSWIEVKNECR